MDPEVVAKLLARRSNQTAGDPADRPGTRGARADGRGPVEQRHRAAPVRHEKAVSKHCTSIFAKLDLPPSEDDNRRVLAVLAYLNS